MPYNETEKEDLTYTTEAEYDPDTPLENEKIDTPSNDDDKKDVEKDEQAPNDTKPEEQQAQENKEATQPKTVPYQRFQQKVHEANELNQKYRELELELAKLQGANDAISSNTSKEKLPPEEKVDIKQLRKAYHTALLEGDDETALSVQDKIDSYLEKQAEVKAQEIAKKIIEEKEAERAQHLATQESVTRKTTIDNFLKEHDYLDDQAANFNEEAFEIFSALFKSSQSSGMSFEDSLKYAVEKSDKLLGINTEPEKDDKGNGKKNIKLTKEQIEEQLERAKKAPPKSSDKGMSAGGLSVDPSSMSEEEFAKFRDGGGKFDFEN